MTASGPSRNQLETLWKSGVPLDSAWIEFAVFLDAFAVRALATDPGADADVLGLDHPRYRQLSKGWLPMSAEARSKKLAITTKNERISLLNEIYAGRLWAIGYRSLPDGSDELVRVPRQPFYIDEAGEREEIPDIHWGKGQLTVGSASYFSIRIARPPATGDEETTSTSTSQEALPDASNIDSKPRLAKGVKRFSKKFAAKDRGTTIGGRPNTNREIRREFQRLWNASPAFRILPVKRMVPEVRAAIRGEERRDEESGGYRSSSMAKIIGQERTALRNRNNRNKPSKPRSR
jgi:hypothetical protein